MTSVVGVGVVVGPRMIYSLPLRRQKVCVYIHILRLGHPAGQGRLIEVRTERDDALIIYKHKRAGGRRSAPRTRKKKNNAAEYTRRGIFFSFIF